MQRRTFLKAGLALPTMAAASALPRLAWAGAETAGRWRVFEVTTQVEVLHPAGTTRVWLPLPLTEDTPYQKGLGNTWKADGAVLETGQDAKFGAAHVLAEWPEGVQHPLLELTSRIATRDRAVDLTKPGTVPKADPAMLAKFTEPTDLLPTDGIVRDTAQQIIKEVRGGHLEQASAVYTWVVENTFRDPKTRGCGVGDIKTMLETRNLGGEMR